MKYKFITTVLCLSVLSITACGSTVETTGRADTVENIEETGLTEEKKGEEINIEWTELGYLESYPEIRNKFDEIIGNTKNGEDGTEYAGKKEGFCYADLKNHWTNNSTLRYAFNQPKFHEKLWDNEEATVELVEVTKGVFADIESDNEARLAAVNAYYNLFAMGENYFNGNETLSRAEFLTGVYKAHNPFADLRMNNSLKNDSYNKFVNQMLGYIYLDMTNETNYTGSITRAEAIYTLVEMYNLDANGSDITDIKDGGDITLEEALQNPDQGLPTDLYEAINIASASNLIDGNESRWDDPLTKTEALELITNVYSNKENIKTEVAFEADKTTSVENESQTSNQTQSENIGEEVGHVQKLEDGSVACTPTLLDAINASLKKKDLSTDHATSILYDYYDATRGADNTKIHNDIIDRLVDSLAKAIKAHEQAQKDAQEQAQKEQQQQQNQGNTGGNTGSSGNSGGGHGEEPENWEAPPAEDPWAGDGTFEFTGVPDPTGGELITNGTVTMP